MSKRVLIWTMLFLIFIVSIILGYLVAKNIGLSNAIKENEEMTMIENDKKNKKEIKTVNSEEDKIGANTKVVLKKRYNICGHEKIEEADKQKVINLTEKELQEMFKGWHIEEFSKANVIIAKRVNDICDEHYYITIENGLIVVYKEYVTEKGEVDKKKYITSDIAAELLPEEDFNSLKTGKELIGRNELNKFLEDYE